jgi:glycosyltransferase involved in cell wall biosynthesis
MILLSHPTGNQNVRHAALAFARAGMLAEFWTCIQWDESGLLDRLLPAGIRRELRRRSFPQELQEFIRTSPWRELARQLAGRLGGAGLSGKGTGAFSVDAVYRALDRRVARRLASCRDVTAVYGYDDGALETFRAAKAAGVATIYEHPIIHWRMVRRIQEEEAVLHPAWIPTLGALRDSAEKFDRKDEELALADQIVVASTFSADSLALAPGLSAKIHIVPYGAPSPSVRPNNRLTNDRLRVIFVGGLGQAKGLGYLLEAAQRHERHIELTLVGKRLSPLIPEQRVLDRHRWIPSLAHDDLLAEMSRHDVLVFPSLHEGFGLVILEAMSQGLAVITTPHTGGPDVIREGQNGFIVPIRSADAIAEKLGLLAGDRRMLAGMKEAARETARRHTWENYRKRLVEVVRGAVGVRE